MKNIILLILLTGFVLAQSNWTAQINKPPGNYITEKIETDTTYILEEELFLKEISDKALAKEEKRKKITNRVLAVIIVILLVDKFIK